MNNELREVFDLVLQEIEAERQNLRRRIAPITGGAYGEPAPIEEQLDDIDAERFKQMVKTEEQEPEDIDTERFKKIERK